MVARRADRERRALWVLRVSGTSVLVLGAVLLWAHPSETARGNVPGFRTPVVGFELASTPEHVARILGDPDSPERTVIAEQMDKGTRIDFLFALAYPGLYAGIALFLNAHGNLVRGLGAVVHLLAAAMVIGDWLENKELLTLCWITEPGAMEASLDRLRMFTLTKWYALFAASAIVATGIWREQGWYRWTALVFALAAIVGFASWSYLPAIEYSSGLLFIAWMATYARALFHRRRATTGLMLDG